MAGKWSVMHMWSSAILTTTAAPHPPTSCKHRQRRRGTAKTTLAAEISHISFMNCRSDLANCHVQTKIVAQMRYPLVELQFAVSLSHKDTTRWRSAVCEWLDWIGAAEVHERKPDTAALIILGFLPGHQPASLLSNRQTWSGVVYEFITKRRDLHCEMHLFRVPLNSVRRKAPIIISSWGVRS